MGKTPAPGHDLYASINAAGNALFNDFNWECLTVGPVPLPVVAGQDYIDLPDDFGQCLDLWVASSGTFPAIEVVDRTAMGIMRSNPSLSASGILKICFNANQPSTRGPTRPRAMLDQAPTVSGSPTIQLIYMRGWASVGPADNAKNVNIPEEMEHALDLKARATACLLENQNASIEEAAYQAAIKPLKEADALRQPGGEFVRGGVNSRTSWRGRRHFVTTNGLADLNR